ncbi:hypothetical protein E3P81_00423 [Wallemia ichthyophaga]|nr:hypothetical protein E3P97_00425 [Wallemia ichthyophaga]TIB35607.1 hypothetical protein E3P85_00425 [Wallemia ichthyophaga]TIB50691.1 hypothetical protein E3P82_00425 [Wallemia ichthyophaga]TIB54158.1 hypothetical protein E3P81_00423 [Wallemia ichthyophaga]TIB56710.1 hypothetical protein E3P80_00425 [Wallemia ichthyophaga]
MSLDNDAVPAIPNLALAQCVFVLQQPSLAHIHDSTRKTLIEAINRDKMAPFAASLPSSILPQSEKDALVSTHQPRNQSTVDEIHHAITKAQAEEGESEISDNLRKLAVHYVRIGDKPASIPAITEAINKTAGIGHKIDLNLLLIRLGLFTNDHRLITQHIAAAQTLVDQGGDWDRRNRLKVYVGLYALMVRDFHKATTQFLDTLSTFTSYELLEYDEFIIYTVIVSLLTLDRVQLKQRIIESPEVVGLMHNNALIKNLANSLYDCNYALLFKSLAGVEETYLLPSRYWSGHARFYSREIRIRAYGQLLESYKSLNISHLANTFGVSDAFVHKEFSSLIPAGRLNCTLDSVANVVVSSRKDARVGSYQGVVAGGDNLLNSVQKLARVLN